jgi:hypothetical protein
MRWFWQEGMRRASDGLSPKNPCRTLHTVPFYAKSEIGQQCCLIYI